ncbi:MAG TPA: relaxase/mobilization nuclease domain-containing protein, partial [Rhizomicrobium sp.]|nr:relaxase/mobilization nuclease domain-containing protein [Rhizomicrobium sp.]
MISKGNTHKNGVKLANYMNTGKDGERAELWQLRGFEATNIVDAFRDVQIMAGATKCEQPFFHVQVRNREGETLNRHQWEYAADRIERMLGLTDQPRAIVFHVDEKTGHEHMHIAWSRIDQETLKARPLPFFKERLKKISRELEFEFGLEAVTNRRPDKIKYAPTRAEDEQARRLGLDPHQLRNTIRSCYERSDCGASLQAALEHEGMILAKGDRRDFVVIDREGGMHALGKRILDDSVTKIRARLSDLSRDNLPSVEQARILVLEKGLQEEKKQARREKPEPAWDRDRADRQWQDAVVNAAIDKEKIEQKFVETEQRQRRAGSRKKEKVWPISPPAQEAVRTSPRYHFEDAARESTKQKTAPSQVRGPIAEIHAAWTRADTARAFVSALEERNFAVAVVTE